MPHVYARTDDETITEMCEAVRRDGKKIAGIDFGERLVGKWCVHIPEGPRSRGRDLARQGIIARGARGESLDAICSLEACSPRFAFNVLRAHYAELDAWNRLSLRWCPRRRPKPRKTKTADP